LAEYPALDLRFQPGSDVAAVEARLYAALDDHQPIAIQEHDAADGWLVFFRSPALRDAAAAALVPLGLLSIAPVTVPDEDWARRSQADLTAVTVGRITVAPPWDPLLSDLSAPIRDPVERHILIVIDPSMGFGTGHHQTTRLCLALLQSVDVNGRRVIDVGTGSGVLAIAAWHLGASAVVAIDHDPDALQNARENVERNGAGHVVEVAQAELLDFAAARADLVTANLTAAVLRQHAATLRRLVSPGGSLIVSGFSPEELADVAAAFEVQDVRALAEGEWTAAVIQTSASGSRLPRAFEQGDRE
jgi:ribosomal protein L11 methyltransferase